jgi:hypothetical protein
MVDWWGQTIFTVDVVEAFLKVVFTFGRIVC